MKFSQVTAALIALIGCANAIDYGSRVSEDYDRYRGASGVRNSLRQGANTIGGHYGRAGGFGRRTRRFVGGEVPKPYSFDYTSNDREGNTHYRNEQGDKQGNVKGTYGYADAEGLYRIVEYVADANGFRANIRSNEPGVGKKSPANIVLVAEKPPAGIQDKFAAGGRSRGTVGYGGGYRRSFISGVAGGSSYGVSYGGASGTGSGTDGTGGQGGYGGGTGIADAVG